MPGARFFIIARPALYLARWEGRKSRLDSVTKGRCYYREIIDYQLGTVHVFFLFHQLYDALVLLFFAYVSHPRSLMCQLPMEIVRPPQPLDTCL